MKDEFKKAENFAKTYYQLEKSGVEKVDIKSAIRFAERYHQEQLRINAVMQPEAEKVCEHPKKERGLTNKGFVDYCPDCMTQL